MGSVGGRANGRMGRIMGRRKGARQLERPRNGRLSAIFTPKWRTTRESNDFLSAEATPRRLTEPDDVPTAAARDLWSKVVQIAMVSGMVLFVVGAARLLGWVLAVMQVPQTLASSVVGMAGGQAGFMVLTILVFLVLGAILEGVPAAVLLTPILLPLARELGIDPVHYGAVIVATQGISVFLPPVGVSLLVACSVGGVEPAEVARPLWPYLALMLGLTVVIALVPGVVLWLPNLLGY